MAPVAGMARGWERVYHIRMKRLRSPMPWRYLAAVLFLGFAVDWTLRAGVNWLVAFVAFAGAYNLALAIAMTVRLNAKRS